MIRSVARLRDTRTVISIQSVYSFTFLRRKRNRENRKTDRTDTNIHSHNWDTESSRRENAKSPLEIELCHFPPIVRRFVRERSESFHFDAIESTNDRDQADTLRFAD